MNIIKISNLNKSFGEVRAVQDLSLKVKEGELFAFLGVNGAGKSTAISIMCGQLAKDSGKVIIDDLDLDFDMSKIKNKLGVVFQNSVLDKALTVKDNLESRAALYGINGKAFKNRLSELSQLLEFDDLLGRAVGKLSGGLRRRIDVARALLHEPKILILDEPTSMLDISVQAQILQLLKNIRRQEQMAFLFISHDKAVINYMCDRQLYMQEGRIT